MPTWNNFYRLDMYNLKELQQLLERKVNWQPEDVQRHQEILAVLGRVAKNYELTIPQHWM